jgi:hypothetical protein
MLIGCFKHYAGIVMYRLVLCPLFNSKCLLWCRMALYYACFKQKDQSYCPYLWLLICLSQLRLCILLSAVYFTHYYFLTSLFKLGEGNVLHIYIYISPFPGKIKILYAPPSPCCLQSKLIHALSQILVMD